MSLVTREEELTGRRCLISQEQTEEACPFRGGIEGERSRRGHDLMEYEAALRSIAWGSPNGVDLQE